ncbi:hypothetical protein OJAV_G00144810 [Oryzias javanicus]|uniref:Uncharacterized protein n=1 Tax=Oryzias javanicus TaxID=123683 RepID=A0A3S2LYV4_ORYJA|nr:hypothetical protein OJAV_G00144810 [Oryzias javanicus]
MDTFTKLTSQRSVFMNNICDVLTCHTGPMRTASSRIQCSKAVDPQKGFLGGDENGTDRFDYYLPGLKTLKNMLESTFCLRLVLDQDASEVVDPPNELLQILSVNWNHVSG